MEDSQKMISEILKMDDSALSQGILRVANSMGVDPNLAGKYLGDMGKIRKAVSSLTEDDLEQIRKNLGDEKMNEIISGIQKEMGEG